MTPIILQAIIRGEDWRKNGFIRTFRIHIFLNSRFTVSALLVLNFFMLVVIPDLVLLIHHLIMISEDMIVDNIVWTLFLISHISDAIIYMFTQPEVKKILCDKLSRLNYVLSELSDRRSSDVDATNNLKNDIEMNDIDFPIS